MLIGKRISGRYKIIRMIGGGGMANVYLARDMILDRDVALKVLRMDFSNDEEFIKRFHREAQSATSLTHPNIVSIYDVGEEDGIYYIVMEYVDGMTLKQYIQAFSPIPVEKALDIMKQITSALALAHQNHIVHRDIKPHNVLIDHEDNVKITDFGIAMALSATSITQTNSVLGSVHYLSPEQARGGMANKKSDIYSLGIVMFELLTGRLPFSGESAVSIALKHLQSETPSPRRWNPAIPQSVENIVLKATAKDSFHRYASVEEMAEDLNTALNPERLNESKFVIPEDDDVTKAIPIITNDELFQNQDETKVIAEQDDTVASGASSKKSSDGKKTKKDKKEKKNKKADKEKKPKKKRSWVKITAIIFGIMVVLAVLAVLFLPGILAAKDVEVPDVSDTQLDKALSALGASGLEIGEVIEREDDEIEDGNVIKTEPEAGSIVKEGSSVDVYYSIGKKKVEVLNYIGRDYEDIENLLENFGYKDIVINKVNDESEVGTVLEQEPGKGESVIPSETVLTLTVSNGPAKVNLKDLTDYTKKALDDYAADTGLRITFAEEQYSDSVPAGQVISQSPAAGTALEVGSEVNVVLSKGAEEIPPQEETKEVTITYDEELEGTPQTVTILIEDLDNTMTEPVETFEITETVKKTLHFRIPYKGRAGYKIIKDNSVYDEGVINYSGND
ncbi:serine/threonine protein kinase [Bacillus sp. FJAT-27916]|uniref:Stk1 family PASTA domain-containing Ser/Thr kinase n=1 Tax=Bacillaceae TaxID=186817 RepID=UPI00067153A2|nr:Stk1 family PASTA domain-containing Ser/Thr kinase [Bacillus sp. FJAT-27916]KMY45045.1 serine/threonine protein kinase [Bacillus sp. FJAT-27916]